MRKDLSGLPDPRIGQRIGRTVADDQVGNPSGGAISLVLRETVKLHNAGRGWAAITARVKALKVWSAV